MPNDLFNRVEKKEDDLVICDFKNCKEYGEYIRCYFDIFQNCPIYIKHKQYIKEVEKLKKHYGRPDNLKF